MCEDGGGCPVCDGRGQIEIGSCPSALADAETLLLLDTFALAEHGTLPAGGGLLDQTRFWLDGWRFYRGEVEAQRAAAQRHRD